MNMNYSRTNMLEQLLLGGFTTNQTLARPMCKLCIWDVDLTLGFTMLIMLVTYYKPSLPF